jgi:hypothetical protein
MGTLSIPRDELRQAREALASLRVAQDFNTLDQCWITVLKHLERCWNKTIASMNYNTKWQGWPERGRIEGLRKTDQLLAYLRNARGAEEHGIAPITLKQPGGVGINPAPGSNSVHLERISFNKERLSIYSKHPYQVTLIPAQFALLPVKNRGVIYPVPQMHLGQSLASVDPVTVASAGITFYSTALDNVSAVFGR